MVRWMRFMHAGVIPCCTCLELRRSSQLEQALEALHVPAVHCGGMAQMSRTRCVWPDCRALQASGGQGASSSAPWLLAGSRSKSHVGDAIIWPAQTSEA